MVICDDRVLIAYDCSGSTGHDKYYYSLIKQLVKEHPNAEIVAWDDRLTEVPREVVTVRLLVCFVPTSAGLSSEGI